MKRHHTYIYYMYMYIRVHVCKQLVKLHEQSSYGFQKSSGFRYSDINENITLSQTIAS